MALISEPGRPFTVGNRSSCFASVQQRAQEWGNGDFSAIR